MSLPKLFTVAEVAKILGVTEKSVRDFINAGELTAAKVGRWRITRDSVEAFIAGRTNHYRSKALAEVQQFLSNKAPLQEQETRTLVIRDYHCADPELHGRCGSEAMHHLGSAGVTWRYIFDRGLCRARHIFCGDYAGICRAIEYLEKKLEGEQWKKNNC